VDQEAPQVDSGLVRRSGVHRVCCRHCGRVKVSKSGRDLQDANARVKAAVDDAGREEVAATTGGDSFCYAKIDPTRPTKPGTLDLMVIHHGKYALHDVTLFFHVGYAIRQRKRKRIEECFGWLKTIALLRKVGHRGILKVGWNFTFAAAAYHLIRMRNLAIPAT
jgi:hypothetical protein